MLPPTQLPIRRVCLDCQHAPIISPDELDYHHFDVDHRGCVWALSFVVVGSGTGNYKGYNRGAARVLEFTDWSHALRNTTANFTSWHEALLNRLAAEYAKVGAAESDKASTEKIDPALPETPVEVSGQPSQHSPANH